MVAIFMLTSFLFLTGGLLAQGKGRLGLRIGGRNGTRLWMEKAGEGEARACCGLVEGLDAK
jgi:hypothetical protein